MPLPIRLVHCFVCGFLQALVACCFILHYFLLCTSHLIIGALVRAGYTCVPNGDVVPTQETIVEIIVVLFWVWGMVAGCRGGCCNWGRWGSRQESMWDPRRDSWWWHQCICSREIRLCWVGNGATMMSAVVVSTGIVVLVHTKVRHVLWGRREWRWCRLWCDCE